MNQSQANRFHLPILFVIQMDVFDLVYAELFFGERPFKQNFLYLALWHYPSSDKQNLRPPVSIRQIAGSN
jgi:hypothetical protein